MHARGGVHRRTDTAVAQSLAHDLQMNAFAKKQGGMRRTEIVKSNDWMIQSSDEPQARWQSRRFQSFVEQQIDVNRGWKAKLGEPPVTATSLLVQGRMALGNRWSVQGGFDNRRNVRLYRNLITPETEFDDSYRQGFWAGAGLRVAKRTRLGVRAQRSSGGFGGKATSLTATATTSLPHFETLGLRLRGTSYHNPTSTGWFASVSPLAHWSDAGPAHHRAAQHERQGTTRLDLNRVRLLIVLLLASDGIRRMGRWQQRADQAVQHKPWVPFLTVRPVLR